LDRGKFITIISIVFASLLLPSILLAQEIIADHNAISGFDVIPLSVIESIDTSYNIYYVHTSHGSQIMTGIYMLYNEDNDYDPPPFHEVEDDLGHDGDTSWVPATRSYLDGHPECNIAIFSWYDGCSDNTVAGINIYLNKMVELETDYPYVKFIYMTGHLDGTGVDSNLYVRNNQIRDFCNANERILFDFADIESYDPDGNYYPDDSDSCAWCYDWCAAHSCPGCSGCAHSHCFNCYLKGKAWWWMMARISGWNTYEYECGNTNGDHGVNVSDAVWTMNYLFQEFGPPMGDPDVDECGSTNISDIIYGVDYVMIGGPPPCNGSVNCYLPTGDNKIMLECPEVAVVGSEDSVAIAVYLSTDTLTRGFSLGLIWNSNDIQASSVDYTGSLLESYSDLWRFHFLTFPSSSPDKNKVIISSHDPNFTTTFGPNALPAQDSSLLFKLWFTIPPETPEQVVDIDTISFFVTNPDIEYILAVHGGGSIKPAYYDCGTADLMISNQDYICGDANGDEFVNVSDAVWIINYVFVGGDAPNPMAAGDVNCDATVNVSDAVVIINFVFVGGYAPCDTDGDEVPDC
jgi:Dockerin type I domain